MTENPAPKKKSFKMVTSSYKVAGEALRDDPSVRIHPSGYSVANRGGSDLLDKVANTTEQNYLVKYGVDVETDTIAVYLGNTNETGLMRIRRLQGKGGSRIAFHLGGVWKEYPHLRPASKGDYAVRYDTDADGVPCLEIAMQAPLNKRKGSADPGDETKKSAASED